MGSVAIATATVERVTAVKSSATSEVLVCERLDGTTYERELACTPLAGWGRMLVDSHGLAFDPVWVEFGEVGYGVPCMEILFTGDEFDRLEGHARLKAGQDADAYARWKTLHRVPVDAPEPLYYIVPPMDVRGLTSFAWTP